MARCEVGRELVARRKEVIVQPVGAGRTAAEVRTGAEKRDDLARGHPRTDELKCASDRRRLFGRSGHVLSRPIAAPGTTQVVTIVS